MKANRSTLTLAVMLAIGSMLPGLVAAPADAAPAANVLSTREYPVEVRCARFGDDGQHCEPGFNVEVDTRGVLRVRFVTSPRGCSDFHVRFFHEKLGGLPANTIPTSGGDYLAPGASSREVTFSESGAGGRYRVTVLADGRPGGCNTGRLENWGGTLFVTTSLFFETARQGDTGVEVRTIQHLLNHHGAALDVDGDYGPVTTAAVQAFQQAHGLGFADKGPRTGELVDPETWAALLMSVRRGDQGDAVRAAQNQLATRIPDVEVDGEFGPQTEQAVRAIQQSFGLPVDGVMDLPTWSTLLAAAL
jgi:hypothetical protein